MRNEQNQKRKVFWINDRNDGTINIDFRIACFTNAFGKNGIKVIEVLPGDEDPRADGVRWAIKKFSELQETNSAWILDEVSKEEGILK